MKRKRGWSTLEYSMISIAILIAIVSVYVGLRY